MALRHTTPLLPTVLAGSSCYDCSTVTQASHFETPMSQKFAEGYLQCGVNPANTPPLLPHPRYIAVT